MVSKKDLEDLSEVRLQDAIALLDLKRYSGAYYLSGYAVELAIKAYIAKTFQPNTIPDLDHVKAIYSHDLNNLIGVAGLRKQLDDDLKIDNKFAGFWGITTKWNESSRYSMWDVFSATNMITAVNDANHGAFQWVKKYW